MLAIVEEWEHILPPYAIRRAREGMLEVGAQLCTRDGRRMGNAHIIKAKLGVLGTGRLYYTLLTDAGTVLTMNSTEINECFWPPRLISDVNEVLRKFARTEVALND